MLSKVTTVRTLAVVFCVIESACADHRIEREFFRQPLESRVERLRRYSLDDQYRIFRYGNDVVHPPLFDLATPIAERGAAAIPFLMARLGSEQDDFSVRDILRVVSEMTHLKNYDVKADETLIQALSARVDKVKDKEWKAICMKMLSEIKKA